MKERSKERMAELLLQELFEQLSERENVKRLLGDMSSLPVDEVVEKLAGDFEHLIARHVQAMEVARGKSPISGRSVQGPATVPLPLPPAVAPAPVAEPPRAVIPPVIPPPLPPRAEPAPPPAEAKVEPPRKIEPAKIEPARIEPAKVEPARIERPEVSTPPVREERKPEPAIVPEEVEEREEEEMEESGEDDTAVVANVSELRTPTEFSDDDIVYLHGVSLIPESQPHESPFLLEEKGIDPRGLIFAFDYEGMRFYLSKVLPTVMNISKTGMLLLGKQESLQLQGAHESILNDLRMHGVILPFRFGIIARGRDDLMGQVDEHKDEMEETLEALHATRWWVLNLQVLDGRIAQLIGSDATPPARKGRMVERASYSKTPMPKKYDIKMLERMLNREKRLAESVHEELKAVVDRADIDEIVSLGSGSSEEWKSILKASYEVQPKNVMKFFHAVTDLQYRHLMFDLMLSVSGDGGAFSFDGK